jgi:hypothetical protein
VHVRTGPLSQVQQGPKWQERATRKCPVYRALSSGEAGSRRRFGETAKASTRRGPVSRRRRYSPAARKVANAFTGLLSQVRLGGKWRREQPASALIHGLSTI